MATHAPLAKRPASNQRLEREADRAAEAVLADRPREPRTPGWAANAQRKTSSPSTPPPIANDALAGPIGAGRALDAGTRTRMERGFGQDFTGVRVYADEGAQRSARAMGARAYTIGDHIVFGPGHYRPGSPQGQRLIAHELAHVVQQRGGAPGPAMPALSAAPAMVQRADETELSFLDGWLVDKAAGQVLGETTWRFLREILRGLVGGVRQNVKQGGLDHVEDRLKQLFTSPRALASFYLNYVKGLALGLVSPIVDLWHLLEGAFKLELKLIGWMTDQATALFRKPQLVMDRAQKVLADVGAVGKEIGQAFGNFIDDPVKAIGQLNDWIDTMMQAALGQARAKGHEIADDMFKLIDLDWGDLGEKIGHVIGSAVIQILMMVFSDGIGNMLTEAGALVGKIGARIGAEAMNILRAAGQFVTKLVEGVKAVSGTVLKAFEGVAAKLLKLFDSVKALIDVAMEQLAVERFATAGDAPAEAMMSKATRFEPKGTRTTMTTVEELTGKGAPGPARTAPKPSASAPKLTPTQQRGSDILEEFAEGQGKATSAAQEEEFAGGQGRGVRDKPGGVGQPKHYEVGNFSHDYAEELVPELKGRTNLDKEFKIPGSNRRIDRVDHELGELIEVKPDTPKWMDEGRRQLKLYKDYMDREYPRPGGWKTKLVTYDRDAVNKLLEHGWPKP